MNDLKEVVIETTNQCNLSCIHCGSACENKKDDNELSIEEWKGVLSQLAKMGVEKVVFSGGEPTLKDRFEELLLFSSNALNIKVGFITNGLLVFNKLLQRAMSHSKPFAVGLSVDGMKLTHNKIRRNPNSWSGLMENISILQELKIQICIVTTLHKLSYHELPRLANFLRLAEIDSWQLQLAMPFGRMKDQSELLLTEEDFQVICREVVALRMSYPELNIQAADCFGVAPENLIRTDCWGGCTAGISSMGLDSCGNVMPCLSLQTGKTCGSVREKPIVEIWQNSPGFDFNRHFQIGSVEGDCQDCEFLGDCRGGCNSQSFSYYGRFHSSPFCFMRSFGIQNKGEVNAQCD